MSLCSITGASRCQDKDHTANQIAPITNYSKLLGGSSKSQKEKILKIKQDASTQTKVNQVRHSRETISRNKEIPLNTVVSPSSLKDNKTLEFRNTDLATEGLSRAFQKCYVNKTPPRTSTTSYSVMFCKRRKRKQIFTTEHLLPACQKCSLGLDEEQKQKPLPSSGSRSRRIQRRSWPVYNNSTSKKLSPPVSPLKSDHPKKHIAYKGPISSSSDRMLKDQGRTHSKSDIKETKNVLISNHPRKLKRSNYAPRLKHKPGDTISNREFHPIPVAWRNSNRSIWDDSAAHLLEMTMSFLKDIPKVKQIARYM